MSEMARRLRSIWRKLFYPHGPRWWPLRCSNVSLIIALHGCDFTAACEMDRRMADASLASWLEGRW